MAIFCGFPETGMKMLFLFFTGDIKQQCFGLRFTCRAGKRPQKR